jgi:hypothetical protein
MNDQKKDVRATPNSEFVVDVARKVVVYIKHYRYVSGKVKHSFFLQI